MLAKVSAEPSDPSHELLKAPNSLIQQSFNGCFPSETTPCSTHRDGCGVAWVENHQISINKTNAIDSWNPSFQESVSSLRTQFLIAHNRKASPGLAIDSTLSHPYSAEVAGRRVAFCHNGGVRDFMLKAKEHGVTDSMLFLKHISSRLQKIDMENLAQLLHDCANTWTYSSLTGFLLVDNGVFAWRCFDPSVNTRTTFERYYTLFMRNDASHACIASEKIDDSQEWALLPNRALISLSLDGDEIRTQHIDF